MAVVACGTDSYWTKAVPALPLVPAGTGSNLSEDKPGYLEEVVKKVQFSESAARGIENLGLTAGTKVGACLM